MISKFNSRLRLMQSSRIPSFLTASDPHPPRELLTSHLFLTLTVTLSQNYSLFCLFTYYCHSQLHKPTDTHVSVLLTIRTFFFYNHSSQSLLTISLHNHSLLTIAWWNLNTRLNSGEEAPLPTRAEPCSACSCLALAVRWLHFLSDSPGGCKRPNQAPWVVAGAAWAPWKRCPLP